VEILSADQIESIHQASLRILAEVGVECLGDPALDAFAGAAANVDGSTRRVRLDPAQTEALMATAPATFRLHPRSSSRSMRSSTGARGRSRDLSDGLSLPTQRVPRDIRRAYDAVHTSPSDAVNVSPTLLPPPRRRRRRSGPRGSEEAEVGIEVSRCRRW
jgi:hypothetical protein